MIFVCDRKKTNHSPPFPPPSHPQVKIKRRGPGKGLICLFSIKKPTLFPTNSLYLAHARAVTSRVNTITGLRYADDPTILAWNLINEPRATGAGDGTVAAWVGAVAPTVKSFAPRQLLTVGSEGFYGRADGADRRAANPNSAGAWAEGEGQSFARDHASDAIDFASIHMWPNNWKEA